MSNHHLLVDEANKRFFDCEKYLLPEEARHEQPFEAFWLAANDGYEPPETSNRYSLAEPEARAIYAFMVAAAWTVRGVDLDHDMYDEIYPPRTDYCKPASGWTRVGKLDD